MSNEKKFDLKSVKEMLVDEVLFAYRELNRADDELVDVEEELISHALFMALEKNEDSEETYKTLWALIYMAKGIGHYFEVNG